LTPTLRRLLSGVGAVAVLALAGCAKAPPAPSAASDVDRARAAYLADEPIVRAAVSAPQITPGVVHADELGWDRTEVDAEIYESAGGAGPTPGEVEQEVAAAVRILRSAGWTIHWEMCLPPPSFDATGVPQPDSVRIPIPVPRADGHEWLVAAYKITGGVSYWALVMAAKVEEDAAVNVVLRAPNARDEPNLLPSAPDPVPTDRACAEDGTPGTEIEQAGTPLVVRDWLPFPGQDRTPSPNVR
jgi:hypothetical protein